LTANVKSNISVDLPGAATEQQLNLSTFLDATAVLKALTVKDTSGIGFKFGLQAGAGKIPVMADGTAIIMWGDAAVQPTLFFDAVSATDTAYIEVGYAALVPTP
jgi:hypothetical protein